MDKEKQFEKLGKEILRHKYLYYQKGAAEISDFEYDNLESKYIDIAKTLDKEPEIHLICDWEELSIMNGFHAACIVGYDSNHPWAKEVERDS